MAKNVQKGSRFGALDDLTPTTQPHTSTHTHTHTDTPTDVPTQQPAPIVKERKTRRVQLLLKESSVQALDDYAKLHDTSRNDIIQNLVEKFISDGV